MIYCKDRRRTARVTASEQAYRALAADFYIFASSRGERPDPCRRIFRNQVLPNPQLAAINIPDATPEIVTAYALSDEQALLAKVRYNRLLDIFLGVTAYSLQSHLRTHVKALGQVEIDEIYVAVDSRGRQYILPVQQRAAMISCPLSKQDRILPAVRKSFLN